MITVHIDNKINHIIETQQITAEHQQHELIDQAVWIDLFKPTKEEEAIIERHLGANIPTPEEMIEIELSSRLYKDNEILYMTTSMIAQSESKDIKFDSVSFLLTQDKLITIRYIEPQSFRVFSAKLHTLEIPEITPVSIFIELLDTAIDRIADILELIGRRLEEHSTKIFRTPKKRTKHINYLELMQEIGINGDLNTKVRESLLTFNRLVRFFSQNAPDKLDVEKKSRLLTLLNDITSLNNHADFLSTKVVFLLDATLGMIGIEQNNIIKIFSVAAVIFMPPTLIASIFGMNFHFIPELSWHYGYYYALVLMLISMVISYLFFKTKKWL